MLARLVRVFLAVTLLAAWQSALEHPVEHVDELGEFIHLHGGHSDESAPLCDTLSALTACAAMAAVFSGAYSPQQEVLTPAAAVPRAAEPPPFLSQAPPACV